MFYRLQPDDAANTSVMVDRKPCL